MLPVSLSFCEQHNTEMVCRSSCLSQSIEKMLRNQPGIINVSVALLAEKAVVEYSSADWTAEKVGEAIEDIGFDAFLESDVAKNALPGPLGAPGSSSQEVEDCVLSIYGMTCSACVASIENGLREMPGVISCDVALTTERARITYDASLVGIRSLVEGIEDMGFDAVVSDERDSTQLQSLSRVKEIAQWRRAFLGALTFGVPVFLISMVLPKFKFFRGILMWQPISGIWLTDLLCLALTIPVQFGIGLRFYRTAWKAVKHGSSTMDVLVVLGTTASFTYSVMSMLSTFLFSSEPNSPKPTTFFDTSTMLITFVSFGRYLENTAKGKTSEALSRLIGLAPSSATIYTDGEKCSIEKKIAGELVQRGDYVKVVPGDRIPADGTVVRGSSTVDESVVTGEAMPVSKIEGSRVIGGTVNGLGTFDFVVDRAGKDSSLAQIIRLVSDAQTSKAPIQAFADRIAGIFVPCVIALGLLTFTCWLIIAHVWDNEALPDIFVHTPSKFATCLKLCISVVVVACPCALGLATPTAVMVGTGVGAQNGILIKGGGPLEASVRIKKIVFDKTGTLTMGKVAVTHTQWVAAEAPLASETTEIGTEATAVSGLDRLQALRLIGTLESRSEHPLAHAIACNAAQILGVPEDEFPEPGRAAMEDFENIVGKGVRGRLRLALPDGRWSSHQVAIGNWSLVFKEGASVPPSLSAFAAAEERQAHTLVYAAIDGQPLCAFSLSDQVRPEARAAIEALHHMGISTALATGDSQVTAEAVAGQVGIPADSVYAAMSPLAKSELVARLQSTSPRGKGAVAFVGDGINDAPALVTADVGIALSCGSQIALESSSIVLVRNTLLDVPASLLLARRIFLQIRLNFAWSTAYNLVALPIAMGLGLPWGLSMHPMMAGAAMAASSVSVVGGSLTLRFWRRPKHLRGPQGDDGEGEAGKTKRERRSLSLGDGAASVGWTASPFSAATAGADGSPWWRSIFTRAADLLPSSAMRRRESAGYTGLPTRPADEFEMA